MPDFGPGQADFRITLHAQRAARAIARRFDDAMRSLDLGSGQFSQLTSLDRPKPPTLGSVARLLSMDRTTLTANVKPLQRRGSLNVTTDPMDRRARRLALTGAKLALLEKAVPIWLATHAAIEGGLAGGVDALRADLTALRSAAAAGSPERS